MKTKQSVGLFSYDPNRSGASVELQAAALEATANAIVITDQTGTVIWVNSAFEQLSGYQYAEIVGKNPRVLKSDKNSQALYQELWRTILEGSVWRGELINRRKDGSLYDEEMTITPVHDHTGKITHYIANKLDVSGRIQSETKLKLLTERLSLATAASKVGVWEWDMASNLFTWDATTFEIYGFTPVVPLPYDQWVAAVHPQDLPAVESALRKAIVEKGEGSAEFRIVLADGAVRIVSTVGRVVLDERANVIRVLGTVQDITERKRTEDALRRLAAIIESSDDAIIGKTLDGTIQSWNGGAERLYEYSAEEVIGKSISILVPPGQRDEIPDILAKVKQGQIARNVETVCVRKDGKQIHIELTVSPVKDAAGTVVGVSTIARDITERVRADERLRLWSRVLDQSAEGIFICDPQERILLVNKAFRQLTGYSTAEALGKTPRLLQSGRHGPTFYLNMWKSVTQTGAWRGEMWNRRKNGELFVEWLSISAVYATTGAVTHYVGIFSDITAHKQAEERVVHLAHYDALTDLPNRVLLMDRLSQLIKAAQRSKSRVAVVFIDLDRFKEVNDSLGHDAGDLLLKTIARRLSDTVRGEDTVARLGGDEFVAVLQGLHTGQDVSVLVQRLLACLVKPVTLNGYEVTVTASMGISLYPDDATNVMEMIRNADAAMYQAKSAGRDAFRFYTSDMNKRALELLSMENALRRAIERNEFVLHYQPLVNINSGSVVGAEALIRWNHPDLGLVMPGKFISVAEDRGLIVPIGNWVIEEAARQAGVWRKAGLFLPIALNVSAIQFRQKGLAEKIANSVRKHGITPNCLELELTESLIMRNAETAIEILEKLHGMGFSLAIDDFGTGYSSLSYLGRFPIDKIKIDRSFVTDATRNESAASIVAAIIGLARNLKLKVIAEGVETREQLDLLRAQHCDEAQGFLFSPPVVPEMFENTVSNWKPTYLGAQEPVNQ